MGVRAQITMGGAHPDVPYIKNDGEAEALWSDESIY